QPTLSNRKLRERWEKLGSKDTFIRAKERVEEILEKPGRRLRGKKEKGKI
ncbi:unnamed protein product, partial [marine sediment metagenome]